jgi:hypothetical protein
VQSRSNQHVAAALTERDQLNPYDVGAAVALQNPPLAAAVVLLAKGWKHQTTSGRAAPGCAVVAMAVQHLSDVQQRLWIHLLRVRAADAHFLPSQLAMRVGLAQEGYLLQSSH